MNYATEMRRETNIPTFIEKIRLIFGLLMMVTGLYLGFSSVGIGESLGFLSVLASPFVMVSGK